MRGSFRGDGSPLSSWWKTSFRKILERGSDRRLERVNCEGSRDRSTWRARKGLVTGSYLVYVESKRLRWRETCKSRQIYGGGGDLSTPEQWVVRGVRGIIWYLSSRSWWCRISRSKMVWDWVSSTSYLYFTYRDLRRVSQDTRIGWIGLSP